jgi:2-aminophenol/2-amino-5-chlorophenol 1,6-dioxygenase subunit beta
MGSTTGTVVSGCLAPHPPHLLYAMNPPQNEPEATGAGAWKSLLDGYDSLRESIANKEFDVIIVHTPHWKTVVGHHILGVESFKGLSVDPIFPNLFRYNYDLKIDVELSEAIAEEAEARGLVTSMMRNPDFRVDYGTLTTCHLVKPEWDTPIVVISSGRPYFYYNNDVGDREMLALGEATLAAIQKSGKRALVLASNSLSHRHFTDEPEDPEDPSFESIYNDNQLAWDKRWLSLITEGKGRQLIAEMPDFIEQATSECKDGSMTWLLATLGVPDYPGVVHGYGSIIGTGNAIVEWTPGGES